MMTTAIILVLGIFATLFLRRAAARAEARWRQKIYRTTATRITRAAK